MECKDTVEQLRPCNTKSTFSYFLPSLLREGGQHLNRIISNGSIAKEILTLSDWGSCQELRDGYTNSIERRSQWCTVELFRHVIATLVTQSSVTQSSNKQNNECKAYCVMVINFKGTYVHLCAVTFSYFLKYSRSGSFYWAGLANNTVNLYQTREKFLSFRKFS